MPIYEYCCESCGHELEALQKIADPPLTDCPTCDEPALKKKISAAAFRLKGSGWYETDFKKGDQQRNVVKDDGGGKTEGATAAKADSGSSRATTSSNVSAPSTSSTAAASGSSPPSKSAATA